MIGKLMCAFRPHHWLHMMNVSNPCGTMGLYRCQRCHEWSPGSPWVQDQHTPQSLTHAGVPRRALAEKE